MITTSAHPRESGDPVLSSLTRFLPSGSIGRVRIPGEYSVPAFAGMSGFKAVRKDH